MIKIINVLISTKTLSPAKVYWTFLQYKKLSTKIFNEKVEESYKLLNIPVNADQQTIHNAFIKLAKKYHPDSGSPDANIDKFMDVENAFRILSKYNMGSNISSEEVERIVYDIRHTAPQHRQYLSFEGIGHGTPYQREKQWIQHRAQKAANNIMEYRVSKAVTDDKTLMVKGEQYGKKHDIKTKYGFDRLVEDLIQESMSKGEFDNLSGKGKPLKEQNTNPYVDFTTHKLNEVLINNGFTPEWITMSKEIDQDIKQLKQDITIHRMYLGPYPLSATDKDKWDTICDENRHLAKSINTKINKYNLIVPLIDRQKFLIEFDKLCEEILKDGEHSKEKIIKNVKLKQEIPNEVNHKDDLFGIIYRAVCDLITLKEKKKDVDN